jgi:hypothetical protein
MQARIVFMVGVALAASSGCAPSTPPSPLAPVASAATTAPGLVTPPAPSASGAPAAPVASAAPSAPASATAEEEPAAPPRDLTVPRNWTRYTHKRLGLSFAYPKATFRLTETTEGLKLQSTLSRDELGENPKPEKWFYEMTVRTGHADVIAVLKKDLAVWYDMAFPKGVFDPDNGSIRRTRLAGLDGYRLSSGIEGYNTEVLILARGPKTTLVIAFSTIGDVMGPDPTSEEQNRVFAIIEGSMQVQAR